MSLDLDKSAWRRVKFGDVVTNLNVTVKDPESAGIKRIIAMEHLDPGELKISRWGDLADGTTFTRRVSPGQTLFGKRRAYQRKAAYAEFDAICSGDILVFEADQTEMLPEFLPFIVQSEGFYAHALGTSAGSMSPRTSWRDLSNYEFDLPPLVEQHRLANLLGTLERYRDSLLPLLRATNQAISDYCVRVFQTTQQSGQPSVPITDMVELRMGRQKSPKYQTGRHSTPYVRVANVGNLELSLTDLEVMDFDPRDLAKFSLQEGDLVLTEGDIVSALNVGRAAIVPEHSQPVGFQNTLIRARPVDGAVSEYLLALFEGMRLSGVFAAAASTTTVTHLGLGRLAALRVPKTPLESQQSIATALSALLANRRAVQDQQAAASRLRTALSAAIFGEAR